MLKGLGLYVSRQSAIASFAVPLARAIRQANNRINLPGGKETLSPYLQLVYSDWKQSQLLLFVQFSCLMTDVIATLKIPPDVITSDKLTYYTLNHPIDHLPNLLLHQESIGVCNKLLSNTQTYATLEPAWGLFNRPDDSTKHIADKLSTYNTPEITPTTSSNCFEKWAAKDMARNAQLGMPIFLSSDVETALINASQSHTNYHLLPYHFNIGINWHLILPIYNCHHCCL
eukprot:15324126-Ditylum_brightwellii.AAC.1